MKLIDANEILANMHNKAVTITFQDGNTDLFVPYEHLVQTIAELKEVNVVPVASGPAKRYKDFNGFTRCSACNEILTAPRDVYCSKCGHKFIDKV